MPPTLRSGKKKFHEVETALLRAEKLWLNASETVEKLENV